MEESIPATRLGQSTRGFPLWAYALAFGLSLIYAPMLGCRFDFIDDGNLVYSTPAMPIAQRLDVVWGKIVANYDDLGPFRPVLWAHWELAADLLQESEFGWRLTRLLWCSLASVLFLALMSSLRLPLWGALFALTAAVWNPYRSEIWTSLTLSEAVAMPYAMIALIAARRAPSGKRPWAWDAVGVLAVIAALGCKNTFMAIIPAQMFLRLDPFDLPWRDGLRRHGARSLSIGLTVIAPIAHLVYFKLDPNPHPNHYAMSPPSIGQAWLIIRCLKGAIGIDFIGVGLAGCAVATWLARSAAAESSRREWSAILVTGAILLVAGAGLYLPLRDMSPRYSMPAVWGLDLAIALLIGRFVRIPATAWKRTAEGLLVLGFLATAAANIGKQQKFTARADVLWQTLEFLESESPPNSRIAFYVGDPLAGGLDPSEAIHMQWHLEGRGRDDLRLLPRRPDGTPFDRAESASAADFRVAIAVTGSQPPADQPWQPWRRFESSFHLGKRSFATSIARLPRSDTSLQPVSRRP